MRVKHLAFVFSLLTLTLFTSAAGAQTVTQLGQFTAPDLIVDSFFGGSAISANTIAVNQPGSDYDYGEIYVYDKPSTGWTTMGPTAYLESTGCGQGARMFISSDGTTVAGLIGACYGGLGLSGSSIEIFVEPSGGWQTLTQPTAIIGSPVGQGECGSNFAMSSDGNTIVCADSTFGGKSYLFIFDKPAGGWTTDMKPTQTIRMKSIITAVAMNGNLFALSTGPDDKVLVLQRTTTGLQQLALLSASNGGELGSSMVFDGQTVVAQGYDPTTTTKQVYVFSEPASGWTNATETAQLTAPNLSSSANLGITLAKSGPQILVGGEYTFAAFLYIEPSSGWQTTAQPNVTILSTDPYQGTFGAKVSMLGNTIVIGDPQEDAITQNNGAAYVFQEQ